MEVLQDLKTIVPVLLGALLALLGGAVTHFVFWRASVNNSRNALRIELAAELQVVRQDLSSALSSYRKALRTPETPAIVDFVCSTPVFDANAGHLGQLREPGLISYIIATYSSIRTLSDRAKVHYAIDPTELPKYAFNNIHSYATATHIQVIKLHTSLARLHGDDRVPCDETEAESFRISERDRTLMDAGQYHVIMERKWR